MRYTGKVNAWLVTTNKKIAVKAVFCYHLSMQNKAGHQKKLSKAEWRKQRKGLNMFYYGRGKGKTTAVIGLAARAIGAGMNVLILQFVKAKRPQRGRQRQSGEWPISAEILFFEAAKNLPAVNDAGKIRKMGKVVTRQLGLGFVGILGDQKEKVAHIKAAQDGLKIAKKYIKEDKFDLIILDELISALELGLLKEKEVAVLLKNKPRHTHLAYTGHDLYRQIAAASDLISEIKLVKHPYYKGILAQRGIDF